MSHVDHVFTSGHPQAVERQVTAAPQGHILTNCNIWSPDGRWIVYDVRSDPVGEVFDGGRIEMVHVDTGEIRLLYESSHGAHCGVVTFSPREMKVAFILGPEHPTADWSYCAWHRQGVVVRVDQPGVATALDARDVAPPFTAGSLRGGSHVHVFDGQGQWVSFTYEDHVLATAADPGHAKTQRNQRNIGISVPITSVAVPRTHPRNHDGSHFTVLVTQTHDAPRPGSDEIQRAVEEAWVGSAGYTRADGGQQRALAFQGQVIDARGHALWEVFIVDLPEDVTQAGSLGPLQGTPTTRPAPPRGAAQRRLTFTADRKYPGIQGPRHWLRSSPDGSRIAFLMKDDQGIVQLMTVSPLGGEVVQVTHLPWSIASAFTWSPDGRHIACVADSSVMLIDAKGGEAIRLTPRCADADAPRPQACVFSPDGRRIAYVRAITTDAGTHNQIFVVEVR